MRFLPRLVVLALSGVLVAGSAQADEIAAADLQIQGIGLKVITISAATGLDIPAAIQTEFGGKQNDEAQVVEGLLAVGELSGPGIDTPIRLETAPGHKFQIPGLSREGVYFLQNIRLVKGDDFLQSATPAIATITVSNLLQTSVRVKQLTPEELRARGISIDARNYDVYEYTFSFLVNGQTVEIPFPVIVDPRTHEARQLPDVSQYHLPPITQVMPPRWDPPMIETFDLGSVDDLPPAPNDDQGPPSGTGRPSIPAALIIPNSLAVLHQFFAVTLMVTNGAPAGSTVTLDSVSALIKPPAPLRTVKSIPAVAFNQPVPIVDATTGVTFLVAQAKGDAEWTMEGLQPGTHTIEVEVRATYKSPGQVDFPLKGTVRASVVVHDPRFNVNFSHPDTVRKDIEYSTFSFITNMSGTTQNIKVTNELPACADSPGANVCRVDGTPASTDLSIPPGEMMIVEYKLKPGITGHVFATAGSVSDEALTASVQLHMGVSESGIPLSPATLVMPYYARFVNQQMVSANLQLLGLGYSLATAPLTAALASHPHVIKTDVFQRATDIARAGQRVFLGDSMLDSLAHMSLDLLGNSVELREWDDLRRQEKSGRAGAASIARELEKSLGTGSLNDFVSGFARVTAWRAPYLMAVTSAGKLSVREVTSNARLDVESEAASGWIRQLPFGELTKFQSGQLAVVGRWSGSYEVTVTPSADGPFTMDVILPATADGSVLRAHFDGTGTAGKPLKVTVTRGATSLDLHDSLGGIAVTGTVSSISPDPIKIMGARQDLNLDKGGHKVSILWNRPVQVAAGDDLLKKLAAQVSLNKDTFNYQGPRPMSAAALQEGGRVANVTFDHSLSVSAAYSMTVGSLVDPLSGAPVTFPNAIVPVIDNDAPGGIIFGHVLKGDNSPIEGAEVRLFLENNAGPPQYDSSRAGDGSFLFEFVPRDIDNKLPGTYKLEAVTEDLKSTSVLGAVRLPGSVHFVNLVFLGRGSAEGYVRYDNGQIVPNADVVVGSTLFDEFRKAKTDSSGHYTVGDLPVGPLTFIATDADGNVTYAAAEIKTPGQLLHQDLSIYRRPFPGTATIRGVVKRSDTNAVVAGAHVGVYSQGYGLIDGFTDSRGAFEFLKVPTGFVTVLASEWTISREAVALDFDLATNETRDLTLTLNVKPAEALVTVEGFVTREDALHPGDPNFFQKVAGALVKIDKAQVVTADANGHYVYPSVPVSFASKPITAYDPATKRTASTNLPSPLDPSTNNNTPIFISTASGYGEGTIRVRLLNAAGFPVSGFRVIVPGIPPYPPPTPLDALPNGIYQLPHVKVGSTTTIWAVGDGSAQFGFQYVSGSVKVEFNGHIAALTLRLPGAGTVRVKLAADIDVIGDVKIAYQGWDEASQMLETKEITKSTSENGIAGYATFTGVPAVQNFTVASQHPIYGYASQTGRLGFDGDVQSIALQLNKLSTVRGVIYAIDGRTPVAGAAVHIEDGRQNSGIFTSLPDGSFVFYNVPANVGFRVMAEVTQDGTYRTGVASGSTPALGGPVSGVSVILRTQGGIDGRIVYAGYKKFDPQNPANNIVDDTPNDLSDNAPVPLANFVLRELDFPYRSFGTTADPSHADIAGRFTINNVFTGPLRVSASDPGNQEDRGTWTGSIGQEGQRITAYIGIGAEGFGPVTVRVLDPNNQNAPVINAEVTLIKGFSPFDLATTDGTGTVRFEQVPVGTYYVTGYSKALGKSGSSGNFTVTAITGATLDIVLQFSGKVNGKFSDPEANDRGVPGAPVTLTAQTYQTRASTDVEGLFSFDGVREGLFKLDAKDTLSNRRASASHLLTQADPNPYISLLLEPTETLNVSVYLPNDSGGNSNILAPIVNIEVRQRYDDFLRALQGNAFQMAGLFRNERYYIAVKEIGGSSREIHTSDTFPKGSSADPLKLVFPAYGTVEVHVVQGTTPAVNAKVNVYGGGKSATVYTDGNGIAPATGIPLGPAYINVTSIDGAFSGSGNVTVTSQSNPAVITITLGAFAGVSGLVEAELGGPSINTRVVATFSGRLLEGFTDSTGRFIFQGIPTGSHVDLTYIGPDDVTVGAKQSVNIGLGDASKVVEVPKVKLDATPPLVQSIFPPDGASNVSPDAAMKIVFTEPINTAYINTSYIQLVPADSSTPVPVAYSWTTNADGTFTVTMTPPAPPSGQQFPLKSNTLYRIIISGEIRDLTGNKLPATRGASFITSDYAEPHVIKVIPAVNIPLQPATTFEFRFNEPIDPAPWQSGGSGQFHFYKISTAGPGGTIIAEKPGHAFLDPSSSVSLFFAPNDPIEQESFYRVVFSGVRDPQGNTLTEQTFHFFSYDLVKPFVTPISPVPETFPLISGSEYVLGVDIRNGDANGAVATDVAKVDYFRVDGATQTYIATSKALPWSYRFVAPEAPPAGSAYTLRAIATDLSGNESAPATITWDVKPNKAPQNVSITLVPPDAIYPGNHALAKVTFEDEGTFATVQIDVSAMQTDGSSYTKTLNKTLTRAKVNDPWPDAAFDFDLPPTLKEGTTATFHATVTDVRGLNGSAPAATLNLSVDAIAPQALSLTPAPQTSYNIGQKYQIVAVIKDMETGASEVTFAFDNQSIRVAVPSPLVTPGADHTWTFNSGLITVPAKNVDTTIPITITAKDYNDNVVTKSTEVIYNGVNDPTVPKGAWLCPIEKAVYPANSTISVKLQARATDDIAVTAVKFTVPGIADPITATRVGTSDVYEATTTLTTGADGTSLTLTATISDANPDHDITLQIPIDAVAVDITVDNRIQAITPADIANYTGKSIYLRGVSGRLIPHAPISLKNLIVLDGARVDTLATTTTTEQKLDLTITDRLYVDCASSIDVSARGYLGGWGVNADGSNTKNEDKRGRTVGNTANGGPTPGASASYGGLGGEVSGGVTNAAYGSISDPFDLGTGGAGTNSCCSAGAVGGGAIRLRGGIFAIAGAVRADGATGIGAMEAGSGGSVNIKSSQVIVGPSGRITANGGDDDGALNAARGAGGGRVAIDPSDRFDVESVGLQIQARGGRNNTSSESPAFLDGGAGTIFVRRPGQTLGELYASSLDERSLMSAHLTRPTPLSGTLRFDRLTLGARALVRADASLEIGGVVDTKSSATIDATAVLILNGEVPALTASTTPANGSSLIQTSILSVNYTATSAAGIGAVTLAFSPVTPNRVDSYFDYRTPATPSPAVQLTVPFDAVVAPATLTLSATDRAGRSISLAPLTYSIVANTPTVIDQFDPVPLSLYPGHTVATTVSAHDDLKITKITFTSTIGTGTPAPQVIFPNVPVVTNQNFNVAIPIDTPGGQTLKLDLAVEDGFPNRAATTQTKNVSILKDTIVPEVTITLPANDAQFNEGTGNTIQVKATINDLEVGVKQAFVQIGTDAPVNLTKSGPDYVATLPVPSVDGTDIVSKPLIVTGKDYEGNSTSKTINIRIQPLNDPNAPVVSWACATSGAMYPAGHGARLRVFALGNTTGNPANGIQKVEMFVDGSQTPIVATPVTGLTNYYETIYTIPTDAVVGSTISVRAIATNVSGSTEGASTSFTVITGLKITADKVISATDTTYDNQTVIVQSGTTTIAGSHTFDKLIVLNGAKVTHAATDATTIQRLTFTATSNVYVSCTGTIDVSGLGFTGASAGFGRTWPNTTTGGSYNGAGGSHGGRGGQHDANGDSAPTYGSLFDPNEPGGAGGYYFNGTCNPCNAGGGIARLTAKSLVVDGKVLSNGLLSSGTGSGAGGSIRIDVETLSGAGEIHADGAPVYWTGGGGGRIAIYYQTLTLDRTKITAAGGLSTNNPTRTGAAGTVYLRQNDVSGTKIVDEIVIDNLVRTPARLTTLPSIGTGTVSAVNSAVVTLSGPVPEWIEGSTVEFLNASGTQVSSYEIVSRTATTATLRLGSGETAANVAVGNTYRGTWRFDQVTARGEGMLDSAGLRTALITTTGTNSLVRTGDLRGDDVILHGRIEANGLVETKSLALQSTLLTHSLTTDTTINRLTVKVDGAMTVDATSTIDVAGRGFTGSVAGYGRTWPNTATGGSYNGAGGSHGGRGGQHDANGDSAAAYGSVFDPNEPGGAGGYYFNGTCNPCNAGGGIARIAAKSLALNGKVLSNGVMSSGTGSGAGGSIRIDVETLSGAGEIHADGAPVYWTAGGGGRVAIYYQTLTLDRTKITAAGGLSTNNPTRTGAAGTVYFRQTDTTGAKVSDELVVDNLGRPATRLTTLPAIGTGTVIAVNGAVVTLSNAVPEWIEGTTLEFLNASGALVSSYEIVSRTATTATLRLATGETAANVAVGNTYRGTWRIDQVTARGEGTLESSAGLRMSLITTTGTNSFLRFGDVRGDDVILRGRIEANGVVETKSLALQNGAVLTHTPTTDTTINRLTVKVDGTITVDAASTIDVTGRGFTGSTAGFGRTWPNTTTGGSYNGAGGSHGGRGGQHDANGDSAATYGSLFDPNEPGGAGGYYFNGTCNPCNAGGGIARLTAKSLVLDGKVLSNGVMSSGTGSGAGGSIRIDVETLSGAGEIHADGAPVYWTAGGGGRVAIYYQTLTLDRAKITAAGGLSVNNSTRTGAPGTVYLKQTAQAFGDVAVDNLGRSTIKATTLSAVGYATVTDLGSDFVKDANAQFLSPDHLRGVRVVVNYDRTKTWPILSNDNKMLHLDVSGQPLVAETGQPIRGLYKFDNLKLRNAKLETIDLLEVVNPIDKDAPSSVVGNNQARPLLNASLISLQSTPTGAAVVGSAGAVTDLDTPIVAIATNTATGNVYQASVNDNGSFAVGVQGNTGDAITFKARDGNFYWLESPTIPVGTLSAPTPVPSQIPKTDWTGDTSFLPRTLAHDGAHLAIASYPTSNGSSGTLVILGVSDPAHPALIRALNVGIGAIKDVTVSNGWAYIAANRFATLNLTNTAATPNLTGDQGGEENGVEVVGGYAFTAESGSYYNDGRIHIYDVSTPSTPRYIGSQGVLGGVHFTDLIALGTEYLIALTPDKTSGVGHDVVVIDRRESNNLKRVADIDIPNFDAFRGAVFGTKLYVASTTSAQFVAVDLANPAAPVVLGSATLPAGAGGVVVVGPDAFAAGGAAGLLTLNVANAVPVLTGATTLSGNAFDVDLIGPYIYVANETGIALVPAQAAPQVSLSRISMTPNGTMVTINGAPQSVTGSMPITVDLTNTNTDNKIIGLAVQSDGSFTSSLPATAGDRMTIKATDAFGHTNGPLSLGGVPFGSQTASIPITAAMADSSFLARNIATEGNDLVVTGYFDSDKIVLFDVTNRANPVYKRAVPTSAGAVRDVAVRNGWAFIAANRFMSLNLTDPAATPVYTGDQGGEDNGLAVVGSYAFTAESGSYYNDGRIHIYDISTPSAPRYIRSEGLVGGGIHFTGLAAMGTDYLIAVTPDKTSGTGHDVVVVDRRDINDLKDAGELDIANFEPFHVTAVGTTAYVTGTTGIAVIDVADPAKPKFLRFVQTPGYPYSLAPLGSILAVADGSAGATFLDISNPGVPVVLGNQVVGGNAWDCALNGATLYVANEQGIAVIDGLGTPPLIDRSLITTSTNGATTATVIGSAQAILGLGPLTAELRNATTNVSVPGIAVAGDGSFSTTITGVSGDLLTLKATDRANRVSGPVSLGSVPFGSVTRQINIVTSMSDSGFLARNVAADGNDVVVADYFNSDKIVIFDGSTPGNPVYERKVATGAGAVRDLAVSNGWAYVVANRFMTLNLSDPAATPIYTGDQGGEENAVEVVGGYAFTSEGGSYYNDGRIHIYDVSTPSSPRYISSQGMLGGGIHFTGLAAMGTDYLIGVTTDKTSGIGHDVMVIDRRDLNGLRRIADLDIPDFEPYRVKAIGNIAYVTGVNGGVAVVDLTNPAAPRFDRFLGSLGAARGIDSSGNIVVVANGTNGVAFIDGSSTPYVIGSHAVPSAAWDVALSRGAMYVATDFSLTAISNVAVPPMVNESLLTVTPTATSTTVSGAPQAVSGIVPVTARVTNIATATSSPAVTVNGDGSFSATVNALPGQLLTISGTDVAGRMTTRNLAGTYGATTTRLANQIAANDGNFRARRVVSDANVTLVSSGTLTSGDTLSSRLLLFRQPNASEPPQIVTAGAGDIRDIEISSGYAFIAGSRFGTINLSDPSLATHLTSDQGGEEGAVAVSGQYAFTTEVGSYYNDGRIHIYNVSNPSSPVYVRSQGLQGGGMHYHGLVAVGASYLIAISNERPGNVDHDVAIIDRTNINNLVRTAEVQIANFDPQDAAVDGATLYVTGGDRGVAIIDIANPYDPKLKTIIDTPGLARGIAISGPNEIVVADSSGAGITFIDVTDKSNPMLTGTQRLTGSVMDVRVVGKAIHVVAENYYHMILRP